MKNHEIGSRLASSDLLHDKIVVGSELVSFFFFFKVHLHEILQQPHPKKHDFSLRTTSCKEKKKLSAFTRRWEVAVSTVQGRRRRREVEIVFTFSLSLKTLISLGHPLYSSSLPLFTFSVFFCLPNIPFIYYLILYVFVLKILFVVKWVVFWRFLYFPFL